MFMASCSLCNAFGPIKVQYNYDLATAHAKTHFLQMKIIDDGIDMNHLFGQCFPDFAPITVPSGDGGPSRHKLFALCYTLLPRKSTTPHVVCGKCGDEIQVFHRSKTLRPNVLIEHACRHLELKMYECRHCVEEFWNRTSLSRHLIAEHQFRSSVGHFRSKEDDYSDVISSMLKACFGSQKGTACSTGATIKSASLSSVRRRTKGSHLAVERQLLCYRLIRKVTDRNGYVQCRICSHRLNTTGGKSVYCQRARAHAYRHSPPPLYQCRLCPEAYFGLSDLTLHLQAAHALPPFEQNYECLADQYHTELVAIMKKCYSIGTASGMEVAVRNLSDSQICRKSARSELQVRRHLLCHQIIRKRVSAEGLMECRLCSRPIRAQIGNTFTSWGIIQHAYLHLDKKLYQCKKCSISFRTLSSVHFHLKKKHALPTSETTYRCLADQFHGDIEIILRQCYGEQDESKEAQTSTKCKSRVVAFKSKLTIERMALCAQLIRECSDPANKRLQCRICTKCITSLMTRNVMLHALVHLDKPIYRCKICLESFTTRGNVGFHIRSKHSISVANNYDCLGDQFHAEIVEMLRKCYNNGPANEAKPFKKTLKRAEGNVRGKVNGSKQAIERQLYCYRLVRKFVKADGKVECHLCKKQIAAKSGEGYKSALAMAHATVHLKKPIYRCSVCSEKCPDYNSISHHLRNAHALRALNNYESLADEFHAEILASLSECYGEL